MNATSEYFYVRSNESGDLHNAYKLGITDNFHDRNSTYKTGEVVLGKYILIAEVKNKEELETRISIFFENDHVYFDGGAEFYKKSIMPELLKLLLEQPDVKILSNEEIEKVNKSDRIRNKKIIENKYKALKQSKNLKLMLECSKFKLNRYIRELFNYEISPIKLRDCQKDVLENRINDFLGAQNGSIFKLYWACGMGKTILSLLMCLKYISNSPKNSFNILIGVPTTALLQQWKDEIKKLIPHACIKIIGDKNNELTEFTSYKSYLDSIENNTEQPLNIVKYKNKVDSNLIFLITTYASSFKVLEKNITFDIKIGDEAHHLASKSDAEYNGSWIKFHDIRSDRTLFMTATPKIIDFETNKVIYSMDDSPSSTHHTFSCDDEQIFGKLIDEKTTYFAIQNKYITDYNITILKNSQEEIIQIMQKLGFQNNQLGDGQINMRAFLVSYMVLKLFSGDSPTAYGRPSSLASHVLIYSNTIETAEIVNNYIKELLDKNLFPNLNNRIYYGCVHSRCADNKAISLPKFTNSEFGIISNVNMLSEGIDNKSIDSIALVDNMESPIRITQDVLRACRIDPTHPDKIANVILPKFEDWENDNKKDSIKTILNTIANIDESITQHQTNKIRVLKLIPKVKNIEEDIADFIDFEEDELELSKIKTKMMKSKILKFKDETKRLEFEFSQDVIINKLNHIETIEQYHNISKDFENYKPRPEEYYKLIWSNYYKFLGIDITKFIPSKKEWVDFCHSHNITYHNYEEMTNTYPQLPKYPKMLYDINFKNIMFELDN